MQFELQQVLCEFAPDSHSLINLWESQLPVFCIKGKGLDTWYSAAYVRRLVNSSASQYWKWQMIGIVSNKLEVPTASRFWVNRWHRTDRRTRCNILCVRNKCILTA